MHPQIKKATDAHNVVLVVVQYQQWKSKSGAGDIIQKILSVHIGAIARDRHLAYRIYEWKEEQPAFKLGPVDSSFSSEKIKHFSDDFNKKGIQAAKALVENFPDNPMSYGQLAHTTLVTGGDEKDVIRLLKKCLEIDEGTKYCKDFLGSITNE